MPLTPFHVGPALLFGYPLRHRIDLGTFMVANVITDTHGILVIIGILRGPIHTPLHQTSIGAISISLLLAFVVLKLGGRKPELAHRLGFRPESTNGVVIAAVSGTLLHTLLDAFTHEGMRPFFPLLENPFLHTIPGYYVDDFCTYAFFMGLLFVVLSQLRTKLSRIEIHK